MTDRQGVNTASTDGRPPGDEHGMVEVRAMKAVYDNGKHYAPGATLHMHRDLVPAHVAAGQVEVVGASKEQGSPADKQARPTKTK